MGHPITYEARRHAFQGIDGVGLLPQDDLAVTQELPVVHARAWLPVDRVDMDVVLCMGMAVVLH